MNDYFKHVFKILKMNVNKKNILLLHDIKVFYKNALCFHTCSKYSNFFPDFVVALYLIYLYVYLIYLYVVLGNLVPFRVLKSTFKKRRKIFEQ